MSVGLDGQASVEATLGDDWPSGLGFLPDGSPLVVSMEKRRLLRLDAAGPTLVSDFHDVPGYLINDMVVDAAGRAYVGNRKYLKVMIVLVLLLQMAALAGSGFKESHDLRVKRKREVGAGQKQVQFIVYFYLTWMTLTVFIHFPQFETPHQILRLWQREYSVPRTKSTGVRA